MSKTHNSIHDVKYHVGTTLLVSWHYKKAII